MTKSFLEISAQGYSPKPAKTLTDSMDNYIHFADETGNAVKCFVMTPKKFRDWYKECMERDLPVETYEGIPIVINHEEQRLSILSILIKNKDS